jgi:hypothetical protein
VGQVGQVLAGAAAGEDLVWAVRVVGATRIVPTLM